MPLSIGAGMLPVHTRDPFTWLPSISGAASSIVAPPPVLPTNVRPPRIVSLPISAPAVLPDSTTPPRKSSPAQAGAQSTPASPSPTKPRLGLLRNPPSLGAPAPQL